MHFQIANKNNSVVTHACIHLQTIYPTEDFKADYQSGTPEIFLGVVACTFLLVIIVFFVYDIFVQRRNEKLISDAARSNAIVTSMFPGEIGDRLLETRRSSEKNLKSYLISKSSHRGDEKITEDSGAKPLADLFLETTVLFAEYAMEGKLSQHSSISVRLSHEILLCSLIRTASRDSRHGPLPASLPRYFRSLKVFSKPSTN